jgi:hypothetical protein
MLRCSLSSLKAKIMQIEGRTNKFTCFYAKMQLIFDESKVMLPLPLPKLQIYHYQPRHINNTIT